MSSRYQRYVLPGIVFQSVLIGGAYATGREIVEYGAKYGAAGWWAIVAIFTGFTLLSALTFEFARRYRLFEYRAFVRALIGPLWPLFDLLFAVMTVVIVAVVSAASASIAEQILGWPYWMGIALVIVLVAAISAAGRSVIERFKSAGTALLYGGYVLFAGSVLTGSWDRVGRVLASGDVSFLGPVPWGTVAATGVLYVGYNLASLPAALFTLDRQHGTADALIAGLLTGLLATVPFALTYLAILVHYPDPTVLEAPVPWLVMLRRSAGDGLILLYAVVVLWTLVETCTGLLHALTDRIDGGLAEVGREPLGRRQIALLTAGVLVAAALLSRFGIIALVARAYGALAWGFLVLFALPLVTVGVRRLLSERARP
jgi:uncharacterized membrane protein YkvI